MVHRRTHRTLVVAAVLSAIGLSPNSAWALCEYFDFRLSADQVVPFAETQGVGWSELHLCSDDSLRGYIVIHVDETVTAVHIHGPAGTGQNGDILYELSPPTEQLLVVLLGPVPREQREWFVAYQTYVDVHTLDHPEGVIRGQILDQGTAISRTPWHRVKRLYR